MILFCGLAANARKSFFRRFAVTAFSGVLLLLGGTSGLAAATFSFTNIYDQTISKSTVLEMNIDLTGISTNPSELKISVRSSNSKLISPDNIAFSQIDGILDLILRPADCTTGACLIELTATDSKATNRSSFILSVASRDNPIGLGNIDDRMIVEGQTLDVFFPIWLWLDKCSGNVVISAHSSNRQLFPDANLTLEGSSTNWHLHWVPEPGMTGQAIMTVVAGVDGYEVTSGFIVTVTPTNTIGDPFLHPIPDQALSQGTVINIPLLLDNVAISDLNLTQFSADVSNPNLLPQSGIVFVKNAANVSVRIQSADCELGSVFVNINFRSGIKLTKSGFLLSVVPLQGLPFSISVNDLIEGWEDNPITISPFVSAHFLCSLSNTFISVHASNRALFAATNITVRGSGTNWSVILNPAMNQSGESIISLTLADSTGFAVATSTRVIVHPVNDPPAISRIEDQKLNPGESTSIPFSIYDPDNSPTEITVRAYSSNTNIVADTDLRLSNQGTNYLLTVRPQTNVTGIAEIFVQAWDPLKGEVTASFFLAAGTNANRASIMSLHLQSDHTLRFEVIGHPNATDYLQTSSDLVRWQKGAAIQLDSGGQASWTNATIQSSMFFRLLN